MEKRGFINMMGFVFRNYEVFRCQRLPTIDVVWYPSLDSHNALLSTIPRIHDHLTFKEFRQLFKKQPVYR